MVENNPIETEVQKRFEEIMNKKLNNQFISTGTLIRFRDACIEQGKQQAMKEELEFLEEWYSICCYKSSFEDDWIEQMISQLKEAIKQGEKGK